MSQHFDVIDRLRVRQKLAASQILFVLGIVDSNGAVHSEKITYSNAATIHRDLFASAFKRWRYKPGHGFVVPEASWLDMGVTLDEYKLTDEEREHVLEHLRRKGWR